MPKKSDTKCGGFTLMEVMVASAVSVIVLAGFMAVFIHAMKLWEQEEIKSELNFSLEEALEKIRHDLRLSSLTAYNEGLMAFYSPTNASSTGTYTAISIPVSVDTSGDGLLETGTNGLIKWNQTIIYHVKPGTPDKLMRTVYAPRYTNATAAQIYAQLSSVVASTSDAQVVQFPIPGSSETGTTKTVFENLVHLTFDTPVSGGGFDCYRPTPGHMDFLWGSLVLSGGMHQVTFTVTNRNPASSANKIVIDYVKCSASASTRDGELFYAKDSHPTNGFYSYSVVPAASASDVFSGYLGTDPPWVGGAALVFNIGNSTGSVTLSVTNDLWVDNNFNKPSWMPVDYCSMKASTNFTPVDVVVSPDKGLNWGAIESGTEVSPDRIQGFTAVTNYLYGSTNVGVGTIHFDGCWARFTFERPTNFVNYSMMITNARVSNAAGTVVSNINFNGTNFVMLYPEMPLSINSDWIPMWEISKTNDYVVRYDTAESVGDLDVDMVVGVANPGRVLSYFRNDGTPQVPALVLDTASWINPAGGAVPVPYLADLDGDGDYDVAVGGGVGGLRWYRNIGTSRSPTNQYAGLLVTFCGHADVAISFADIDDDGDLDCAFNHGGSGSIFLLRNDGNSKSNKFLNSTAIVLASVAGATYFTPEFADIDGDGIYDLFAGNRADGNIYYWRNTGTRTLPSFSLITSAYLAVPHTSVCGVPRFVDIDKDGDLDLFLGAGSILNPQPSDGEIWFYKNTGTAVAAAWDAPVTNQTIAGGYAYPAFANMDGSVGAWGNAPGKWQNSSGSKLGTTNGVDVTSVYGLSSVEVGYPRFAKFRSGVFDTTRTTPNYGRMVWTESVDDSSDVYLRARFDSVDDMSNVDDSNWIGQGGMTNYFTDNADDNDISAGFGRYIQYEAMFEVGKNGHTEAHTNNSPPMLRDVTIDWHWSVVTDKGSLCDVWTGLGLGPDYGIVNVTVDGQVPVKAIRTTMEIYKTGRTGTNYATGIMEVWPLNTRK